jgi:hypothetical protein
MTSIQIIFNVLRIIFIILDVILVAGFIILIVKSWKFRPALHLKERAKKIFTLRTEVFRERWQSVIRRVNLASPESMRLAIIEADGVVDAILKDVGISGEHMADRLMRIAPESLLSLNRLWRAHRLRNELVHTPGFTLSAEEAKKIIEDYESFLKEIGIL